MIDFLLCLFVCLSISQSSLSLVRFRQLLQYADKHIQCNKMEVVILFTFGFVKRWIRPPSAQDVLNTIYFGSVSDSLGRLVPMSMASRK